MHEEHERFMRRAIELARENVQRRNGGPFGAVIVKDGTIIGEGWNTVTARNDPTAHAEIEAIRAACAGLGRFDLAGAGIYTSCEPCPMCMAAIYWARLDRVHYANTRRDAAAIEFDDDRIYRELALEPSKRSVVMTQLLRDEALGVFALWQGKAGRIRY
jgi:tRNA(Arg) A34 adenosine deaminase TadA